ncbi:MAG: ABC transporter substrate-binding protein [Desulfobacteraceae bacterium]|nr:ABC transporter substrate-binding protein [Desulfobacteraceae bacterium]
MKKLNLIIFIFSIYFLGINLCFAFPEKFVDDSGKAFIIKEIPKQVVSLVPGLTEIIFKLEVDKSLKGITYHTVFPSENSSIKIVGGFFNPSVNAIAELNPDVVFISSLHTEVREYFKDKGVKVIELGTSSVPDGIETIMLLGKIFNKKEKALQIKKELDDQIELITNKLNFIDLKNRKRVMRLMGRDKVMTPGSDSFQNEVIALAGGIPHDFNRNGKIIEVTKEEWIKFNPQVLYGCGKDTEVEKNILSLPGWKDVDAVKNRRIYYFPCNLTCRAATNTGYFVQWLAASIYGKEFASKENRILNEKIANIRKIDCNLDYVENIKIKETNILDFKNRSLVIDLKSPMATLSTLEGYRDGVKTLINHYTPPSNWLIDHNHGIDSIRKRICSALELNNDDTSILITGADMNNLAVKKESFKALEVYAFVTAGVNSNAMRMGRDKGSYYEPGTINIIIMSNMQMSKRAMTRAIITATEAKTAVLLDMDIRSSYKDGAYRATGTGTDNVMIVQGQGQVLDNTGGHTKFGQLIAKAVYKGVKEAIKKQNKITVHRNIFQRLKKRGITIYSLIAKEKCDCGRSKNQFAGEVEELLLDPRYAGFMEMALSLSDDYEKGLIKDISSFEKFANSIALEICGNNMENMKAIVAKPELPFVIKIALNALFNGIYHRSL